MSAIFSRKNKQNWVEHPIKSRDGVLLYEDQGVFGISLSHWEFKTPVYLDIDQGLEKHKAFYQLRPYRQEPLYKALKGASRIVDMTGGLLGDSLLFLAWGFEVHTFEGNPFVAKIIENAITRSKLDIVRESFHFYPEYFTWESLNSNDTLYFYDPFFYKGKEKTQVNKEMELLRFLDEKVPILERAKGKRVVVKRHLRADELWEGVDHSFKGKSTRYDRYI